MVSERTAPEGEMELISMRTVVLKDLYKVSSRMWSQFSKAVKHMKMIDLKRGRSKEM